jgi:hypothetical protein
MAPQPQFALVTKTLVVDSRNRDAARYPDPGSYVVELPQTYHNVTQARLLTADVPSSFYVFSAALGNTSMDVGVDGTFQTITIPDGNYSFATMAERLKAALEAAFVGKEFLATIDPTTGAFSLRCTTHPAAVLAVAASSSPLAYHLGFPSGATTTGPGDGSVVSPGVASLNPYTYILMSIDELNALDHTAWPGGGSAFARIALPVNSWNFAFLDNSMYPKQTLSPPRQKLSRLHVRFVFHDGRPVDFHGMEHSFALELVCTNENVASCRF